VGLFDRRPIPGFRRESVEEVLLKHLVELAAKRSWEPPVYIHGPIEPALECEYTKCPFCPFPATSGARIRRRI